MYKTLGLVWLFIVFVIYAQPAWGLDDNNATQFSALNGWDAFEVVTQNDNIAAISEVGYGSTASRGNYDGLGGYLNGNSLSIFLNHETAGAAISRVRVDVAAFKQALQSTVDGGITPFPGSFVTQMGYAYDKIYDGNYHAVTDPNPVATGTLGVAAYGNSNFDRFCSGTSYLPDGFGPGRGFVDPMYLTGEEVAGGKFYAIDPTTDALWEVPDLGVTRWENAALVDTGNTTHTALILSADVAASPGDYIRLYVGEKGVDSNSDGAIDFLERNGLRGGTVYYFDPDGAASTTDLPDGLVTGTWNTSTVGALRETKIEDIHTNPTDGTQLVFGAQNDGVYTIDLNLQFAGGSLDTTSSSANINQIDDDDTAPIGAPDNVTWSANGKIYIQEDGDGNDMWEVNPDGLGRVQIAHALSEPSGIFDASDLLGYQPGSVMLTSVQGGGSSGGQLGVLISPDARLSGDLDGDGFVGITDTNVVLSNWNQSVPPGNAQADPSGDGFVGIEDLNLVLGNWNAGTPPTVAVPEPSTLAMFMLSGFAIATRSRSCRR